MKLPSRILRILAALAALWVTSNLPAQQYASVLLKRGDIVKVDLKPDPSRSSSRYVVDDSGFLTIPGLKDKITAAGLNCADLSKKITKAFADTGMRSPPVVTVSFGPDDYVDPPIFTVGGEVQLQGELKFRSGETLITVIARSGGFTESADLSRVKLLRGNTIKLYDLSKPCFDGSNSPVLLDGDLVIVPAKAKLAK